MKKQLTIVVFALMLAACGGKSASVAAPVEDVGASSSGQGAANYAAPEIPFTGDACEYAKLAFIQAYQEYQRHLTDAALREKQQQARLAVAVVCHAGKDDEPKTWACAEGHSCR